jgi:hypothetical protein
VVPVAGGEEVKITALLRFFCIRADAVYQLDGAAFVVYWQIQARKIGESMDRLAKGLR